MRPARLLCSSPTCTSRSSAAAPPPETFDDPAAGELVKICAWSKLVERADGWLTIEQFLRQRFGLRVTHGIAPDAASRLLPDGEPSD